MSLATVDAATLQPSCRAVLLKGFDEAGFTWFTNYASRKAAELEHGHAALTFWWPPLERSVRVEGTVEKVAPDETAAYFASRPRASQIGAWASRQSAPTTAEALHIRECSSRFGTARMFSTAFDVMKFLVSLCFIASRACLHSSAEDEYLSSRGN